MKVGELREGEVGEMRGNDKRGSRRRWQGDMRGENMRR